MKLHGYGDRNLRKEKKVKLLIEANADVNIEDKDGKTAFKKGLFKFNF